MIQSFTGTVILEAYAALKPRAFIIFISYPFIPLGVMREFDG